MWGGSGEQINAEVASLLDWWALAGVGDLAGESPRDWLKAPPAPPAAAPVRVSDHPEAPAPAPVALPGTLDGLVAWLAEGEPALLGPPARRIAPSGDPAAETMVLIDMPGSADAAEGRLLTGADGRLFDAMLKAIGCRRETIWLAPLCPARTAGGAIAPAASPRLGEIARHHVALKAPKRLLLMGRCAAEAVLGEPAGPARGKVHDVGGVRAVVTLGTAALLNTPALKALAWADLQLLTKEDAA